MWDKAGSEGWTSRKGGKIEGQRNLWGRRDRSGDFTGRSDDVESRVPASISELSDAWC
jgi:hypothetical protein